MWWSTKTVAHSMKSVAYLQTQETDKWQHWLKYDKLPAFWRVRHLMILWYQLQPSKKPGTSWIWFCSHILLLCSSFFLASQSLLFKFSPSPPQKKSLSSSFQDEIEQKWWDLCKKMSAYGQSGELWTSLLASTITALPTEHAHMIWHIKV